VVAAEQQIPRSIHQLHRVVLTAAVWVMLGGAALPGLIHRGGREPAREGQVQALASHDRLQIGVLAQGAPVAFAEATTASAAGTPACAAAASISAFATAALAAPAAAETPAAPIRGLRLGWGGRRLIGPAGAGDGLGPLFGGLGHAMGQRVCCQPAGARAGSRGP